MAFTTGAFDSVRSEGMIIEYLNAQERARILRHNICHWLSLWDYAFDVLSNTAPEAGPNLLASAITDAVQEIVMNDLSSQIADIASMILRSEIPPMIADVLHTQGALNVFDIFCESRSTILPVPTFVCRPQISL